MSIKDFVDNVLSNTDNNGRLICRERNDLEYKETYHQRNWPKYAKTMASFANNRGGVIIFGVKDNPRTIVGISEEFHTVQQEKFTDFLNSLFSPELQWEIGTTTISTIEIGYIFTEESENKPIIAQKIENSEKINSGDVYYRYRARTEKIKFSEMQRLISEKVRSERELLLKHFETILKSSTTNIGIINYDKGSFSTPSGVDVAIDKKLIVQVLKKAKFIKEGSFDETTGTPVLKVTGNIDLAEEIPVPNLEPDIQYPYIQKQMAQKLNITTQELYALIWKYEMKGQKKFHAEITTSQSGRVHKFSDIALQFLAEKINEYKENPDFLTQIKAEYNQR
ncbi:MAG: hypothetical protein DESF_01455 [Desulfovibrio sp.]